MKTVRFFLVSSFVVTMLFAGAQGKKHYFLMQAENAKQNLQYAKAVTYYQQYMMKVKTIAGADKQLAIEGLADCYWNMRNYTFAAYWYNQLTGASAANSLISQRKADILAREEKYAEAAAMLQNTAHAAKARGFLKSAYMKKDSADWTISYLDFNTAAYREFSPVVINNKLIWSTNEPRAKLADGVMGWDRNGFTRFVFHADKSSAKKVNFPATVYVDSSLHLLTTAKRKAMHYTNAEKSLLLTNRLRKEEGKKDASFLQPQPLKTTAQYKYNVANLNANNAGTDLLLSMNEQARIKNADRYVVLAATSFKNDQLGAANFMKINFAEKTDLLHPALHPNGKIIVFSAKEAGSTNNYDLYVTNMNVDSTWSAPKALTALNTSGNELFASFTAAGVLFFSSDGIPGLGGLDIFKATNVEGATPVLYHLPYPVNSGADDFGFAAADSKSGYFTSDRYGSDDVFQYQFEEKVISLSGSVISRADKAGKAGVKVKLYRINEDGEKVLVSDAVVTDANGVFTVNAKPNYDYVIVIDNGGNDVQEKAVTTEKVKETSLALGSFFVDKEPEPIVEKDPDPVVVVVYFGFNKAFVNSASKKTLDSIPALLAADVKLKVIIAAHTDLEGSDKYNDALSQKRADAVYAYLIEKGVPAEKINSSYFGETKPVELNRAWKLARKNRRVEITIAR